QDAEELATLAAGEPPALAAVPEPKPAAAPTPVPPSARVVRATHLTIKPLSVDEAVMQMNLMNNDFYVFHNVASDALCIVYRRKDGQYGLIEPHPPATAAATGT
ncbi:sigma 54 modulation/S30EA ribosomal C-terminal domain-containing protein, partial [Pyxidicoccus fallax]